MPARILIVDDETQNLELMEAMLLPQAYKISLAGTSEQGLAVAHDRRPDLIILDLMMPGISGFEVCARLKTDPQTGGIPVLFVTALTSVGDKERQEGTGLGLALTKRLVKLHGCRIWAVSEGEGAVRSLLCCPSGGPGRRRTPGLRPLIHT